MISSNVVLSREHLAETVAYFMEHDAFCFDVEAFGPHRGVPTQATLNWLSLATQGRTSVIPFGHPNGDRIISRATRKKSKVTGKFDMIPAVFDAPPQQLRPSEVFDALRPLFFSDRTKIAHNATYDLLSTAKYFGEIAPGPYSDTIVLQWLLDENMRNKGLKELVKKYYKHDYDTENVGKFVEGHRFSTVAHYGYLDAKYTWLLWRELSERVQHEGLTGVANLEMDVLGVLLDMGIEGAPVDVDMLHHLEKELADRLVDVEAEVYRAAGTKFNINAPAQKAKLLYSPKTEGGQGLKPRKYTQGGFLKNKTGKPTSYADYSTDAEALEPHVGNPMVKALVEYADVNKLLSTYIRGYLGDGDKRPSMIFDNRIHADFVQYGTVTGRFSCREPNLQNIPRPDSDLGKKIRGLFIAPTEDDRLIVADYGQIEMVVLAHFLQKGALFDGLQNGIDPHTATAAVIFNIPAAEVTKPMRQVAKSINFSVIYGAGPDKVASVANVKLAEAEAFLKTHERTFPEIYTFKKKVIATCKTRRPPHIKTLLGRKRRLPTIFSANYSERGKAERQAVNSLIQGSAADLIKLAMVRLDSALPEDMRIILSVHDELVIICPKGKTEAGEQIVREAMLGEGIQKLVRVPLTLDVKTVDRWSAAK